MAGTFRDPIRVQVPTGPPTGRFTLPGLNLPLNWTPHEAYSQYERIGDAYEFRSHPAQGSGKNLFPTALTDTDSCALPLTTLREFTMLHIMDALTDKLGWEEKIFNDTIAEKWKAEAMEAEGRDVSQNMVNWVIDELRYRAKTTFSKTRAYSVFNGDVVKSDIAVSSSLKKPLQAAVQTLEDIPHNYKDYHPGSDGKVLDLIHPSLYPLIYGHSRILEDSLIGIDDCVANCGKGVTIAIRPDDEMVLDKKGNQHVSGGHRYQAPPPPYSKNFQWLPCEVDISGDDGAKITSYINNLHPQKYTELYSIIEKVITQAIPLWNLTLAPLATNLSTFFPKRIKYELKYDPDPNKIPEEQTPQKGENESYDAFSERRQIWADAIRGVVQPEPEKFKAFFVNPEELDPDAPPEVKGARKSPKDIIHKVDLIEEYRDRGLQIIVKLASIELTPESPEYEGGTWHVEGQLNEHICATALYYYDCENITESRLAFRQQCNDYDVEDFPYEQDEFAWLEQVYGCENNRPAVQKVGSVLCTEGRLLTFPNILQHRVLPFKLADPTKKGHRKILALFLVDPKIRVISTANVPPQQRDWWSEEVLLSMRNSGKALGKLSTELNDKIFEEVEDFPIGMEEAKEFRLRLMEERSISVEANVRTFQAREFSLCEH